MTKNKFMAGRIAFRLAAVVLALSLLAALTVHSGKTEKRNAFNNPEFLSMLTAAYGAESVALDPHIRDFKLPEQIPWKKREAGGETALVYGDPAKPGFYVYMLKRGPNNWSKSHFHDNDRFITVLQGTFWVGTGNFDMDRTVAVKAGGFVRDIANKPHFDGTREDGTMIEIMGMGPAGSHDAPLPDPASSDWKKGPVIDSGMRQVTRPEDMVWTKRDNGSAINLFGNPDKSGMYVQYLKRNPNNWSRLHYHPTDRFITVLGGTMYLGTGTVLDQNKTVGLPKFGFVRDLAQGVHYDGTKDEDLWIEIAGMGPATSTTYEPPK
jgi:quercetin dioxygenase-like cupin family protein